MVAVTQFRAKPARYMKAYSHATTNPMGNYGNNGESHRAHRQQNDQEAEGRRYRESGL